MFKKDKSAKAITATDITSTVNDDAAEGGGDDGFVVIPTPGTADTDIITDILNGANITMPSLNSSHPDASNNSEQYWREYLKKYYYAQFLAHQLAYQLGDLDNKAKNFADIYNGSKMLHIAEENLVPSKHQYMRLVASNLGLVGYILFATEPEDNIDIKIIFRGTDIKSRTSIDRDVFEEGGAGSASFMENSNLILYQICKVIENIKSDNITKPLPISVTIAGHSLGGADAQNCFTIIMLAIAENLGYNEQDQKIDPAIASKINELAINKLRLFIYNSAGVPAATRDLSIDIAKFLYEQQANMHRPQIETYNYLVAGDVVQNTGEAYVLDNVPKEHAIVDVLYVKNTNMLQPSSVVKSLPLNIASTVFTPLKVVKFVTDLKDTAQQLQASKRLHTDKLLLQQNGSGNQENRLNFHPYSNNTELNQGRVYKLLREIKHPTINNLHAAGLCAFGSRRASTVSLLDNNISRYDSLILLIKAVHKLMHACQLNSNDKTQMQSWRNAATSSWSLSDKVWYNCLELLTKIHSGTDCQRLLTDLKTTLKATKNSHINSNISSELEKFLEQPSEKLAKKLKSACEQNNNSKSYYSKLKSQASTLVANGSLSDKVLVICKKFLSSTDSNKNYSQLQAELAEILKLHVNSGIYDALTKFLATDLNLQVTEQLSNASTVTNRSSPQIVAPVVMSRDRGDVASSSSNMPSSSTSPYIEMLSTKKK